MQKKQIIWQCRRGTRELDNMLMFFLEEYYDSSSSEQRQAFLRLLKLPDPLLQSLLMGTGDDSEWQTSEAVNKVVELIRERRRS